MQDAGPSLGIGPAGALGKRRAGGAAGTSSCIGPAGALGKRRAGGAAGTSVHIGPVGVLGKRQAGGAAGTSFCIGPAGALGKRRASGARSAVGTTRESGRGGVLVSVGQRVRVPAVVCPCVVDILEEGSGINRTNVVGPGRHFRVWRLITCSPEIAVQIAMAIATSDGRHGKGGTGRERQFGYCCRIIGIMVITMTI